MTQAPRCDRTEAWAALQGHYQAHGRDLDLREAFARDPGAVYAQVVYAASGLVCQLFTLKIRPGNAGKGEKGG